MWQLSHPQQGWAGGGWPSSSVWGRAESTLPSFYKILNLLESTCRPGIKILWEASPLLTCTGGGPWGMGWSRDVNADMADISTSSLTKMFPCTKVWISGDGGTVMYVEIWREKEREREWEKRENEHVWGSGKKQRAWSKRSGFQSPTDLNSISTSDASCCCVTLGKSFHLSEPPVPQLSIEKNKSHLPVRHTSLYDPAIILPGTYPRETHVHREFMKKSILHSVVSYSDVSYNLNELKNTI